MPNPGATVQFAVPSGQPRCAPDRGRRTVSMVARSATAHVITADAVEFIRFCYARRRVGWPELYDEMCAVASRGLFRGWGPDELSAHGIKFGLFEMVTLST